MHPLFSEWYALVQLNPTNETLVNRWKLVESLASDTDAVQLVKLAALVVCDDDDKKLIETINGKFKEADSSFTVRDNKLELRILACGALIKIVEDTKGDLRTTASLAVHCGTFLRKRAEKFVSDILRSANNVLAQDGRRLRTRQPFDQKSLKVKEPDNPADPAQIAAYAKQLQKATASTCTALAKDLELLAEESNVYWWLVSQTSLDTNEPLKQIEFPISCLLVAKEVADLTRIAPGPISVRGVLDRTVRECAGRKSMIVTLKQLIGPLPVEWRKSWLALTGNSVPEVLTPITFAIRKLDEGGSKTAWQSFFSNRTGLSTTEKIPCIDFAYQFYQERLLLRAIESKLDQ